MHGRSASFSVHPREGTLQRTEEDIESGEGEDLIKATQTEMVHPVPKATPLPLFQDADSAAQLALGHESLPRETPGDF